MTYKCEPCDGANPVEVILTNLKSGSTDQSCADDLPIMLIGQLAVYLAVNPEALYEAIKAFTDQADAADAAAEIAEQDAQLDLPDVDAANGHGDTEEGAAVDDSVSLLEELTIADRTE